MAVSCLLPDILASIRLVDYSEPELLSTLHDIREINAEPFVQTFLQFIFDCSELDILISPETCLRSVIVRRGAEPAQFLAYREPNVGQAIEAFLQVYLCQMKPYNVDGWTDKVTELLKAMIEAGEQFSDCGLYFVTRLLINCYGVLKCNRMDTESSILTPFCKQLMSLYDYKLLREDNYPDIIQKMNYLFEFYWDSILSDVDNARHLTTILFVANRRLKSESLKTIALIVDSSDEVARNAIMSELVFMKDILIAACHCEPVSVAVQCLVLLTSNEDSLLTEFEDKDKIFLLMTRSSGKIQEMAKAFFLQQCTADESRGGFLSTLEQFVWRYSDAIANLESIVLLLFDSFPSFVEIYMYIIQKNSKAISKISTILFGYHTSELRASVELRDSLLEIATVTESALQKLAAARKWNVYRDILRNFKNIPADVLAQMSDVSITSLADHLLAALLDPELDKNCRHLLVYVWLKLVPPTVQIGDILSTAAFDGQWKTIELVLDEWTGLIGQLDALESKADVALNGSSENTIEILSVKQLIIMRTCTDEEQAFERSSKVMEFIAERYLRAEEENMPSQSTYNGLLRVTVNLVMNLSLHSDVSCVEKMDFLMQFERQLFAWMCNWMNTFPNSAVGQDHVVVLLEFSLIWLDEQMFPNYLAAVLQSSESRKFTPKIFHAIARNRLCDGEFKAEWIVSVVAKTLYQFNCSAQTFQIEAISKKLLSSITEHFSGAEHSDSTAAATDKSDILVRILIELLKNTHDYLTDLSAVPSSHRFKALDILIEKLPESITTANRRIVLSIVGDIQGMHLNDDEKTTLQRISTCLQ